MAKSKRARVLRSREMFRGAVFRVTADEVVEPGGIRVRREVVRHTGSVVVLAIERRQGVDQILLERQYRHAAGDFLWEMPAGRIDTGERALAAAKRELREETGYQAAHWERLVTFYPSPGFLSETMTIYLARGLKRGDAQPESDEVIRTRWFSLPDALHMVQTGAIRDGKTILGVLFKSRSTR
jgi:ADP-ribose pyrophosphatase